MKKRLFCLVLVCLMVFAALPMLIGAEGSEEQTFTLSLSTDAKVNKTKGSTVSVDVMISNVPEKGIVSATIPVFWETTSLKLVSVEKTDGFIKEGWLGADITEDTNADGKYYLAWNRDTWHDGNYGAVGYTGKGTLCTLKFELLKDYAVGDTLNVIVLEPGKMDALFNIMNWYMEDYMDSKNGNVPDVNNGLITVVDRMPGDATGDGRLNSIDAARILQYVADWPVEINLSSADVTGEGKVNSIDAARILQYLADWPVELK